MEILLLNKKKEGFGMESIILELNNFLADLNVFYRKLQNYHWNVKGSDFFVVHEKLEEYYNKINDQIDEVAEHILTLNAQPLGTLKDYLEKTTIAEAKDEKICSSEIYKNIINDFETLLERVNQIKEEAEKEKQYGTSSLVDEYILEYTKILWMLKQSL